MPIQIFDNMRYERAKKYPKKEEKREKVIFRAKRRYDDDSSHFVGAYVTSARIKCEESSSYTVCDMRIAHER